MLGISNDRSMVTFEMFFGGYNFEVIVGLGNDGEVSSYAKFDEKIAKELALRIKYGKWDPCFKISEEDNCCLLTTPEGTVFLKYYGNGNILGLVDCDKTWPEIFKPGYETVEIRKDAYGVPFIFNIFFDDENNVGIKCSIDSVFFDKLVKNGCINSRYSKNFARVELVPQLHGLLLKKNVDGQVSTRVDDELAKLLLIWKEKDCLFGV